MSFLLKLQEYFLLGPTEFAKQHVPFSSRWEIHNRHPHKQHKRNINTSKSTPWTFYTKEIEIEIELNWNWIEIVLDTT